MAKLKGTDNGFRGKLGINTVYELNGQVIMREVGVREKPFTSAELANQQAITLISSLLKPAKEFIELGFATEASKHPTKNYHNMAYSYNYKIALSGTYPDRCIDFERILFSKGIMPLAENTSALRTDTGILFEWDTALHHPEFKDTDQVMLLAYFPERKVCVMQPTGIRRKQGVAELILPDANRPIVLHTYISFISAQHKITSDSVYTGKFVWLSKL